MNSIQTRRNKENKISDLFRMKTTSPVLAEENHLKSLSPLFSHFLCLRAEAICFPLPVAANQFPKRPQQLITNSLLHSYVTWQFCLALEMRAWRLCNLMGKRSWKHHWWKTNCVKVEPQIYASMSSRQRRFERRLVESPCASLPSSSDPLQVVFSMDGLSIGGFSALSPSIGQRWAN